MKMLARTESPLRFECYVDNLTDLPYKDYLYSSRQKGTEDEQAFFNEIFLIDPEGVAYHLSEDNSPVLKALMEELQVCRFHHNRDFDKEFSGHLSEFGVR